MPRFLHWLVAPATDDVPRPQAIGAAALRILAGLLWLLNVGWKAAPDFGRTNDGGLYKFTSYAVSEPVFPPYAWVVENLVLPHFTPFGWGVLIAETTLAVLLLTGSFVRLAAALGVAQSLAIGLSVAYAPGEWPWSYLLMVGVHGLLLVSSAGRLLAVDAVRARLSSGRTLARVWGVLAVTMGVVAGLLSLGNPLAPRGPGLELVKLEVGLGQYNVIGGLALVLAGGLLLAAAQTGRRPLALVAAGVAIVAALSLYAQLGFSDPLLGGTPSSAAFFLALAVVAAGALGTGLRRGRAHRDPHPDREPGRPEGLVTHPRRTRP